MKWNDLAKRLGVAALLTAAMLVVGTAEARDAVTRVATAEPIVALPATVEPEQGSEEFVVEVESECDSISSSGEISAIAEDATSAPEDLKTQVAGCKPCKGRTWCKCTYNGMTRSSCDPCCYRNNIGVLTCLD